MTDPHPHTPAQGSLHCGDPVMWVCLVPGPAPAGGELRIRAWTADRKRMESLVAEGLDMQSLYTAAQGKSNCGAWRPIETAGDFATDVDDDNQIPVLLWIEDGGWKGEGCMAFGYILRRRSGELVGKPNGYSGFKVTLWRPMPEGPSLPSTDGGAHG